MVVLGKEGAHHLSPPEYLGGGRSVSGRIGCPKYECIGSQAQGQGRKGWRAEAKFATKEEKSHQIWCRRGAGGHVWPFGETTGAMKISTAANRSVFTLQLEDDTVYQPLQSSNMCT